jgi:hypothetical protein
MFPQSYIIKSFNIIYNVVKLNTNEHGREEEKQKRKKKKKVAQGQHTRKVKTVKYHLKNSA